MFEFVAGMIVGYAISMLWMTWALNRARRQFDQWLSDAVDQIEQEQQQEQTVAVRVEQHGDQFYFYDNDTDAFIAQGHDAEEVLERAGAANRPKLHMKVVSGDPEVVARLRSSLE